MYKRAISMFLIVCMLSGSCLEIVRASENSSVLDETVNVLDDQNKEGTNDESLTLEEDTDISDSETVENNGKDETVSDSSADDEKDGEQGESEEPPVKKPVNVKQNSNSDRYDAEKKVSDFDEDNLDKRIQNEETALNLEPMAIPMLQSVENTSEGVEIKWSDLKEADGYRIYRKSGLSDWQDIGNSKKSNFVDISATTSGVIYTYTVQAYRGSYEEACAHEKDEKFWSGYDTKGLSLLRLSTPKLLKAANSVGGIKISWEPVAGADSYKVYRKNEEGDWGLLGTVSTASYIDAGAHVDGEEYVYTIQACSGFTNSAYNEGGIAEVWIKAPELIAVQNVVDGVKISWDEVEAADNYFIYRKTAGTSWKKVGTSLSGVYLDESNLLGGQEYYYTVRACRNSDISGYDETGVKLEKLSAPVLVEAANGTYGIKIRWKAVKGAVNYRVYRKSSDQSSWQFVETVAGTDYMDTNELIGGEQYFYTVRANSGSVLSAYDEEGISQIRLGRPSLTKAWNISTGIKITWNRVEGVSGYCVYRKTAKTSWKYIAAVSSTSYVDTDKLTSGKKYMYTVRSYMGADRSYYDKKGLAETKLDIPILKKVQNGSGGLKITWKAVKGATSYRVYRKVSDTSWRYIGDSAFTNYTDQSSLASGKKYTYTVRAHKGNDYSSYNTEGIFGVRLSMPKLVSATKVSRGIKVTWKAVKGADSYYVYRKHADSSWKKIDKTNSTSYVDDVNAEWDYHYTIRAIKGSEISWYNSNGIAINHMLRKAQSYSSQTKWLILVDTKKNKVGIYYGRKGDWEEKRSWDCTTGKASTPTPKGIFTVKARGLSFGSSTYTCWYYTQFYGDYLFHSVLYNKGSKSSIQDGRLGMNLSHGCVRLKLSNAKWIYDNIPSKTKVVIY
ncbi:L,D-transpeptidase family protein [Massilistercora timonensis]|uniref:L,D-transpeptidase family protein n=1 Tax=Massilistercora timonensis TaxID=2086584 RepID=UPI00320A5D36